MLHIRSYAFFFFAVSKQFCAIVSQKLRQFMESQMCFIASFQNGKHGRRNVNISLIPNSCVQIALISLRRIMTCFVQIK
jgi:hypothetical protein